MASLKTKDLSTEKRKAMINDDTRPNFYLLLGLNPDESWNQSDFEHILFEKRDELNIFPEIRRIMLDPVKRAMEAAEARELLASQKRDRLKEFEIQLSFLNAQTNLEGAKLKKLLEAFADVLSWMQEFRQRKR